MEGQNYSIAELEAQAAGLSSFNGGDMDFYTGQDDDMLDFGGSIENFAGEKNTNKQFIFQIANAATVTRTAVLWAGYLKGNATLAPGQLADGAFNDTAGNAGLTGASGISGKTIAELFAWLEHTPSRLVQMKLSTDKQAQVENDITTEELNPFRQERTGFVRAKDYQDQSSFQDKILTFAVDVQLDNYIKLTLPFVAASSTTLTWYFGASLKVAKALKKRSQRANRNIQLGGGRPKVVNRTLAKQNFIG